MPEYCAPGVYVEEFSSGRSPIAAVPTGTVAFVGATTRGPFSRPITVESLADYRRVFGPASTANPVSCAVSLFFANGGRRAIIVRVNHPGARRGNPLTPKTVIGDEDTGTGIFALRDAGPYGVLVTPDQAEMNAAAAGVLAQAALKFCETRRVFYILDVPRLGRSKRSRIRPVVDWAEKSAALGHPNAAVYYPRVSIFDPTGKSDSGLASPCGAIAGLYARTDAERGVWKAPAGTTALLHGVGGAETTLSEDEMALLQAASVNPLRQLDHEGLVVWGSRTFQPAEPANEWPYVPTRRLALFIEESVHRGLAWAVFEPNAEPLWARIRLAVSSFMNQLFRAGAFQAARSAEAYFVKCGRETVTQGDIEAGRVNVAIGFAPFKPAEFVNLTIQLSIHA